MRTRRESVGGTASPRRATCGIAHDGRGDRETCGERKLALSIGPETRFERLRGLPGVELAELPPSVSIASCALPGALPADPVDRILAATARAFGHAPVTRDRHLPEHGGEGHVQAMGC